MRVYLCWALAHASELESCAKVVAILAGGGWVLYRFGLLRKGETALDLDLSCQTLQVSGGLHLVTFYVTLANKGGVQIAVRPALFPDNEKPSELVAYKDEYERLRYPVDLLLRRIEIRPGSTGPVNWFPEDQSKSPQDDDLELDLLSEYELEKKYAFWMEPKETYHLTATATLQPGHYLAMATFVGRRPTKDFWRRTFVIQVPTGNSVPHSSMEHS